MDLFEYRFEKGKLKEAPLAARIRPAIFDEFVGQNDLAGNGYVLRKAIEAGQLPSISR